MIGSDGSMVAERARVAGGVEHDESIGWRADAHIDVFTLDQIDACARALADESYEVYAARITARGQIPKSHEVWLHDRVAAGYEPIGAELHAFCAPDLQRDCPGNLVTNLGLTRLGKCLFGLSSYSTIDGTSRGRLGVGDGTTAAATSDTDLSASAGSSHRQFARLDSVPTVTNGSWVLVATHGTGVSNFAWNEWGADGGTAAGTTVTSDGPSTPGLFNHRVPGSALITKTSAGSAVLTATFTVS